MILLKDFIKSSRKKKKWYLKDLAKKTGLSIAFISEVERGLKIPTNTGSDSSCWKFAQIFEINPWVLYRYAHFSRLDKIFMDCGEETKRRWVIAKEILNYENLTESDIVRIEKLLREIENEK